MTQQKSPETTREELDLHSQLPFWSRVARRATGHYPDRASRELLRRAELGTAGRIMENAVSAVNTSQRLNRIPDTMFNKRYGTWVVADLASESDRASVPAPVEPGSEMAKTVEGLFSRGKRKSTATGVDSVGFVVERFSKWESVRELAATNERLGVVAFHDYNAIDMIELGREEIEGLDQAAQAALEHLTMAADSEAMVAYLNNKPDDIA